jgi:hypothetical protein
VVGVALGAVIAATVLVAAVAWVKRARKRSTEIDGLSDYGYRRHDMFSPSTRPNAALTDTLEEEKRIDGLIGSLPASRSELSLRSRPSWDDDRFPTLPYPSLILPPIAFEPRDRKFGTLRIANLVPGDISDAESINNAGVGSYTKSASNASIVTSSSNGIKEPDQATTADNR